MSITAAEIQTNLNDIVYKALKAARLGREVLLHYAGRLEQVQQKFQAGLVSEADVESERVIRAELQRQFPSFKFLGEESATKAQLAQGQDLETPTWILDPLDGTTNYVHGLPVYGVSLGLQWRGQTWVGVVDAPALNEVYVASKGQGAFVNGRRLHVSTRENLDQALLATGFISDIEPNLIEQLRVFQKVVRQARGVRRAGAAALDLCWVARGVFDGYWEKNIMPWDAAAGALMVQEAGGVVTTYRGRPHNPFSDSIIAANPFINKALVESLASEISPETDTGQSAF